MRRSSRRTVAEIGRTVGARAPDGAGRSRAEELFMKAGPAAAMRAAERHGEQLLMYAAGENRVELARRLLCECGVGACGPCAGDLSGWVWTPVLEAAAAGNREILGMLLDMWYPAHCLKQKTLDLDTPVMVSSQAGMDVLSLLIERGASINARDYIGGTAAGSMLSFDNVEGLAALLRKGAKVSAKEVGAAKPLLQHAAEINRPLALAMLLRSGVYGGNSPEILARTLSISMLGEGRTLSLLSAWLLVSQGADPLFQFNPDATGPVSPVADAIRNGPVRFAKYLVGEISRDTAALDMLDQWRKSPLIYAAERGEVSLVRQLLRAGASMDLPGADICPPIVGSCISGQYNLLRTLLRAGASPHSYQSSGSALFHAALAGSKICVLELLQHGAKLNDPASRAAPLTGAILANSEEISQLMLDRGASLDTVDSIGMCPLPSCVSVSTRVMPDWTECFRKLVKIYGDRNTGSCGLSCLHVAAKSGSRAQVEFLITYANSDINAKDQFGLTPLHLASFHGNTEVVEALIDAGCDCSIRAGRCPILKRELEGLDAFLFAAATGHDDCARLLVRRGGADPDSRCEGDMNGFCLALNTDISSMDYEDRTSISKTLLELGTPVDAENDRGNRAVHAAAIIGLFDMVFYFVSVHGADINSQNHLGGTPLHDLARVFVSAQYGVLTRAVELGANTSARSNAGETALHVAARWHAFENCEELIMLGIDVDVRDNLGRTPLMTALSTKDSSLSYQNGPPRYAVECLIANGADVNCQSRRGLRPLHFAASQGKVGLCSLVLLHGGDILAKSGSSRRSCLHFAVLSGEVGIVSFLLSRGAIINARDAKGHTPLFLAAREGLDITVALLLQFGADASIPSKTGRTPLEGARRNGFVEVIRVLHEFGHNDTSRKPSRRSVSVCSSRDVIVDRSCVLDMCLADT